ncbi:MAG: SRPBCC family protein [Chlorobiaceae bacterium]|nr:SRPBCC family protein [Chlorobiaceae bacterium]NTW74060.1 SRPBCC family protein [Chlorobiaceae bacterium]
MSLHTRTWTQRIPVTIGEAWDFFSVPDNLSKITPPEMFFRITNASAAQPIREGMIITYTLYPFMLIPVSWATEITKVAKPEFFEDRQLEGPYEEWRHRHLFREIEHGVEMTDIVDYRLPLGAFGELVESLIVGRRLDEVFAYRRRRIAEILGSMEPEENHPAR